MSGQLGDLRERLFRKRHVVVPSTLGFPPLNADAIARDLKLDKRGRENGKHGLPPPDADGLDAVETEIITFINNDRHESTERFNDGIEVYAHRISNLDLESARHEVELAGRDAISELQRDYRWGRDTLYNERERVIRLEQELDNFRIQNKLTHRTARYKISRTLHYAIFFALFLVETLLNGFFLGETHNLGIMGGLVEACVIAAINLGIGAAAGAYGLKNLFHIRPSYKLGGFVVLISLVAVIVAVNLMFAHYRSALALEHWENAYQVAWNNFLENPLSVADIKSWMLALIGVTFFTAAMLDAGLKIDDPYPGYGDVWRRTEASRDNYADRKQHHIGKLRDLKDDALDVFQSERDQLSDETREYSKIIAGRQRRVESYKNHVKHLEEVANALLNVYRSANQAARPEGASPPRHFNVRWEIEPPRIPELRKLDEYQLQASVERLDATLKEQIDKVVNAYDSAVHEYELIENLSLEELKKRAKAAETIKAA